MTKKRALTFVFFAVLAIVVIAGVLWGYNLLKARPFSAEQQREILQKIIANNATAAIRSPQTAALETTTLSTRSAGGAELASDAQILPLLPPVASDYNYRYTKNVYSTGPAATQCLAFGNAAGNSQYESYEYSDGQGASYYKSISTDSNGDLITYSLSINNANSSEYYEYRGGEFAVKTVYSAVTDRMSTTQGSGVDSVTEPTEEDATGSMQPSAPDVVPGPDSPAADSPIPDTSVTPDSMTQEDPIKQYFGDNAQVTSTVQENGQEYYVIQYSFPVNCNEAIYLYRAADASATYTNDVIYVSWVNTTNFVVYKSFSYLDSVGDATLIDSSIQSSETRNTDFASVANNFNFDYNVEVRTLDTNLLSSTPEEDAANVADYLSTLNVDVLLLNHPTLKVNSIYAYDPEPKIAEGWDYYTERSYYPDGARGDQMYNEATSSTQISGDYIGSLVSVSAHNPDTYQYFAMEGYTNTYTDVQLLENRYGDYTTESQQVLNWTIDATSTTATLYTLKIKSWAMPLAGEDDAARGIMPVEPGYACEDDDCSYTEKVILMSYGNTKYLIGLTPELDVNSLQFESYNTKNSSDMQFLRAKILELNLAAKEEQTRAAAAKEMGY